MPNNQPTGRSGAEVLLDVLRSEGVEYVFGNPGTTELPLLSALAGSADIEYVLGLHEGAVVAMADGYAQASRRPSFVNLHTSSGLGNGIGMLTNALASRTPMVITAGQQDSRHLVTDPFISGDLVAMARPVTRWAHELRGPDELGVIMRRAFQDAASAPGGPVFVSLPTDVLEATTTAPIPPKPTLHRAPTASGVGELARLLAAARPGEVALVLGDEVDDARAQDAAVRVAEALGARVFGTPVHARTLFPTTHPLWSGPLQLRFDAVRAQLAPFRLVLAVAGQPFLAYFYAPGSPLPDGCELLHVAPDPHDLGRAFPTRLGLAGDPRATLEALHAALAGQVDAAAASEALRVARGAREQTDAARETELSARYDESPIDPAVAAHALLRALPPGTPVVDEAPVTTRPTRELLRADRPGTYFFFRGGGLGWGMPAAAGVSLAHGREPVLCIVGDGAAMYAPQALWTAAHLKLPVVFAVVNNREYNILKGALRARGGSVDVPGLDLHEPAVDFVALARSMGVPGSRVSRASDVPGALAAAFAAGGPALLELPVGGPGPAGRKDARSAEARRS